MEVRAPNNNNMESEPVKMEIVEEINPPINQTFQLKTLDVPHYYLRVKL